jgi:hypothetical protein
VILRWTAPVSGTFNSSASVQMVNPSLTGVSYELDFGTRTLAGPATISTQLLRKIKAQHLKVTAGESVYLEVAPGPGSNGTYDDFVPVFTVTAA